jgi:hypothetical protein
VPIGGEELAGVREVAAGVGAVVLSPAGVDLDVDVGRPPRVLAGVDGRELGEAVAVGQLDPAQVGRALAALRRLARVGAERVAVPDVDGGVADRLAGVRVDDAHRERERHAGPILDDVPPDLRQVDVEGAFLLLGGEYAVGRGLGAFRHGPGRVVLVGTAGVEGDARQRPRRQRHHLAPPHRTLNPVDGPAIVRPALLTVQAIAHRPDLSRRLRWRGG